MNDIIDVKLGPIIKGDYVITEKIGQVQKLVLGRAWRKQCVGCPVYRRQEPITAIHILLPF